MPKMKTHSGAAKRFRLTGTGKVMRRRANREPPARAQVVHAGRGGSASEVALAPADARKIKKLLAK